MQEHQDYYEILNLSESATLEDIKRSFRRLARDCHPDLHPNDAKAAERFRLLREAYEVLSDSVRRNRYDRRRASNLSDNQEKATPQVYYVRGVEKILVRDYRNAILALSEAIRLNGRFIEAYLKRCEAYIAIGNERAALEDCQTILRHQPDSAIAYYYRGRARQRLGYIDAAIKAYTTAIRLDPKFAPSYYYRGVAHHELRYRSQAVSDWRQYAQLCKQQGNLQGYRLGMKALSQYSWLPLHWASHYFEQGWNKGSRSGHPNRARAWKQFQGQLGAAVRLAELTVQRIILTLLQVLTNPVGGILSAYGALKPAMVILVSFGFIALAELGFLMGILSWFADSETIILPWLAVGLTPILSLFVMIWLTRLLFRSSRHWTGALFVASSAMLPLAAFSVCSVFFSLIPMLVVLGLAVFSISYTILLLYGGCSQLLNLSESFSALMVPTMIVITFFVAWTVYVVLAPT